MAQELVSRAVLVGNDGGTNVAASLMRAAGSLGVEATLVNADEAYVASPIARRVNWWLRGRRPSRLRSFSGQVVDVCRAVRPKWLLATGLAPIERGALEEIDGLGVETINYLTDDPWNEGARRTWLLDALPAYRRVCSPRKRNMDDLAQLGCRTVEYVPFGFDPVLFFPDPPAAAEAPTYHADVFFAGGADADRIPYIAALLDARLKLSLYGDYWDRYKATHGVSRGHASPEILRKAIAGAAICLCLVRRLNRDGHSMRSFEVPAAGGCMVVEDTDEHREFFGPSGEAVVYFESVQEMVEVTRQLLHDPAARNRLATAAHRLIVGGGFTYRDRMGSMLGLTHAG